MALLLAAFLPLVSTVIGGFAAIRLRHRLHPFMALAGGILVGTALADLLPEASNLLGGRDGMLAAGIAAVVGFLAFSSVEALVHRQSWEHGHEPHQDVDVEHQHPEDAAHSSYGWLAPSGLIVHSTLDGLAIGLGFAAGSDVGLIVLVAVLAHDFADGMNVVTLALAGGSGMRLARLLLALDALAPPFGVLLSKLIAVGPTALGLMLGGFAGVFLSVGAGHLLPEAQHQRPGQAPTLMVLAGGGAAAVVAIRWAIG
jgi:Predicted divalent heavy-metal cations transporter